MSILAAERKGGGGERRAALRVCPGTGMNVIGALIKRPLKKTEGSGLLEDHGTSTLQAARVPAWLSIVVVLAWYVFSAAYLHNTEGWTWVSAFYCCSAMITTTGYGDVVPTTAAGKLGVIILMLVGVTLVTACLGVLAMRMQNIAKRRRAAVTGDDLTWAYKKDLAGSVLLLVFVLLLGAVLVRLVEEFSWLDSFYCASRPLCLPGTHYCGELVGHSRERAAVRWPPRRAH